MGFFENPPRNFREPIIAPTPRCDPRTGMDTDEKRVRRNTEIVKVRSSRSPIRICQAEAAKLTVR
jgi:hypothetical protein